MKIITRAEAKAAGLKRYFTGGPCKNGHISERTTTDGQCAVCCTLKMRARRTISKAASALEATKKFELQVAKAKVIFAGDKRANGRPIARRVAESLSMETYFVGTPCAKGHKEDRFVCSGNCVVCSHAFHKERYAANRQEYALKSSEWVKKNPGYRKEYRIRKPELHRAIDARTGALRRARKAGGVSSGELRRWIDRQQKICYWCGAKCAQNFHIDHYHPLAKGGEHELSNLVIACPTCNIKKRAQDPLEFAASMGRLF